MKNALRVTTAVLLCVILCLGSIPAGFADDGAGTSQSVGEVAFSAYDYAHSETGLYHDAAAREEAFSPAAQVSDAAEGEALSGPIHRAGAASTSVVLPKDTTRIEDEAFFGDKSITSITIPGSVTYIGMFAFGECSSLKEMHFDGSLADFAAILENCPSAAIGNDALLTAAAWFSDGTCFIPISERFFPDESFREYVSGNFDSDGNGTLESAEIQAATKIECYRMGISSLQGVEYFTELTWLDCGFNNLTELDVRSNTKLQTLGFAGNAVSSIDLSRNTALKTLSCGTEMQEDDGWHTYGNNLSKLDVTKNTSLEYLECAGNSLSTLNLSRNPALRFLGCWMNNLSSLNLSNNKELISLACAGNPLTELNLSQNTKIQQLHCQNCSLTSLDLSGKNELVRIRCFNNSLSSLIVDGCTSLQELYCSYNQLTRLSLQSCTGLQILNCSANSISSLNVSSSQDLRNLICWNNQLSSMNLSRNTALVRVNLSANHNLSSLTLGSAQNLEMLWVQNTNLTALSIKNLPIIKQAYLYGTMYDFGRNGLHVDSGDWVGYKYGDGLNPESDFEVDHCQFCVDKEVPVTT